MRIRDALLNRIDAFLARSGMSDRQFGQAVMNDPKVLRHLRAGSRGVTLTTIERIEEFIERHEADLSAGSANDARKAREAG